MDIQIVITDETIRRKTAVEDDYNAIVTEFYETKQVPFTKDYEEPTFVRAVGDITGKEVLDLGCGNGHWSRKLKQAGALRVLGVDLSGEMVAQARWIEQATSLGISYEIGDMRDYGSKLDNAFDLVTAVYVLTHASSQDMLKDFCTTAFRNLRPGGRFVTLTQMLVNALRTDGSRDPNAPNIILTARGKDCVDQPVALYEGIPIEFQFVDTNDQPMCTLINYLWSHEMHKRILKEVGFQSVERMQAHELVPWCVAITATK